MILLTGDIHGDVRSPLWVIQKYGLTPDDILILLGDVGLNYYGADQGDRKQKNFSIKLVFQSSAYMEIMRSGLSIYHPIMKRSGTVEQSTLKMISRIFCLQRMARFMIWMVKKQL
mgnify:CR=1 FL=1